MLSGVARVLRRTGIKVVVLTTCSKSPYEDWWTSAHEPGEYLVDGVPTIRFRVSDADREIYHRAVRRRLDGADVDAELQEAFFAAGMNSPDLIEHVAGLPLSTRVIAGPYFQALVPSLVNRLPGRVDVFPAFHDEPEMRWAPVARMIANARSLHFLTEEEKALAIRVHGARAGRKLVEAAVVGLGVSRPAALRDDDDLARVRARVRERLSLPDRYFIYVGRLEQGKGVPYLVSWFGRWWEARSNAGSEAPPLVFAGAGNAALVPESAAFRHAGFLDAEEKFGAMSGAIALINPSRVESFSYVVMETWITGRPVVVPAACEVTAAHCRRSGGGAVFSHEAGFGVALSTLLDEARARSFGTAGERYVRRNYAWPDVADRMLAALALE